MWGYIQSEMGEKKKARFGGCAEAGSMSVAFCHSYGRLEVSSVRAVNPDSGYRPLAGVPDELDVTVHIEHVTATGYVVEFAHAGRIKRIMMR